MTAAAHVPVMAEQVAALLAPALEADGAVLVDATLGRAGHARALLDAHPGLALIGLDMDPSAIEESRRLLAGYAARITLVHARYDEMPEILAGRGPPRVQGILFDLGVSSPQLDDPERGFAYSYDAPLDMRMDATRPLTAAQVVNTYPAERLAAILREFGEERFAARIAQALVRERARAPLTSTGRLADIIRASIPAAGQADRRQPGQAHLPGAPHRGERRARGAQPGAARRHGGAGARRADRRARLPLARRPDGQARVRRADQGHDPPRAAAVAAVAPPAVPAAHQGSAAAVGARRRPPTRGRPRPGCGPRNGSSHAA